MIADLLVYGVAKSSAIMILIMYGKGILYFPCHFLTKKIMRNCELTFVFGFGTWGVIWWYHQTIHDGLIPTNAINWWYPCIFDTKTPWKRHSITRRVWVMFSLAMSSLLKHHIAYTAWNPDCDTDGMKNKLSLWYVYVRRNTNYSACNPGSLSYENRPQSPTRHHNFISTCLRQSVTHFILNCRWWIAILCNSLHKWYRTQ